MRFCQQIKDLSVCHPGEVYRDEFGLFNLSSRHATVAQLVEQRIRNAWVGGSNPSGGSTSFFYFGICYFFWSCCTFSRWGGFSKI